MNLFELTKAILAVLVVLASIAVTIMYALGMVTVSMEGGAMMGYLLGESRAILADYFRNRTVAK